MEPYEALEMEVIEFEEEDVITESQGNTNPWDWPYNGGTNP